MHELFRSMLLLIIEDQNATDNFIFVKADSWNCSTVGISYPYNASTGSSTTTVLKLKNKPSSVTITNKAGTATAEVK